MLQLSHYILLTCIVLLCWLGCCWLVHVMNVARRILHTAQSVLTHSAGHCLVAAVRQVFMCECFLWCVSIWYIICLDIADCYVALENFKIELRPVCQKLGHCYVKHCYKPFILFNEIFYQLTE